jgi:transcriptional regulator with XRE-family HTH domain
VDELGGRIRYPYDDVGWDRELLVLFGADLRRCRYNAGLSQETVERIARVDQSSISRVERGLVPRMAMAKVVRLGRALGRDFPLGFCPHDHDCAWQPLGRQVVRRPAWELD